MCLVLALGSKAHVTEADRVEEGASEDKIPIQLFFPMLAMIEQVLAIRSETCN